MQRRRDFPGAEWEPDSLRAFLAVPLDRSMRDAVTDVGHDLSTSLSGVGWVGPERLHLTLTFLAELAPARLAPLAEAVADAVQAWVTFDLRLGGLSAFPTTRDPRVIWLGVTQGMAQIADLAARCTSACDSAGVLIDDRAFHAHCTLGRRRGRWRRDELDRWHEAVSRYGDWQSPTTSVNAVHLVESRGDYVVRAEIPLQTVPG